MKMRNITLLTLTTAITVLLSFGAGMAADTGKIPITTTSEKARTTFLQGRDLFEGLRFTDSRTYFEKAVIEDPNFGLAYLYLAQTQPTQTGLQTNLTKAMTLADRVSEGERLMIQAVDAANNLNATKVKELYEKLVTMYPNDERAHTLLGTYYFGVQEYRPAITEYEKATGISPNFAAPYNMLGYSYARLEDYTNAEKAFKKYIELVPNDPNPYDSYAEMLLTTGRYDESITYYRKALAVDPYFVGSYLGIATNLNFLGRHDEARQELQTLYGKARDDGERRTAILATVVSYVDEGNLEMGITEVKRAYGIDEKNGDKAAMAQDLITTADIMLETGKFTDALTNYEQSDKLIQESTLPTDLKTASKRTLLYNQTRVAVRQRDFTTAKTKAQEFRTLVMSGKNPAEVWQAHELSGMIAMAENNYQEAGDDLRQANQQNPYNLYRMALAYQAKGDKQKAKEMCTRVTKLNQLNSLNYAFIRHKAKAMLASL